MDMKEEWGERAGERGEGGRAESGIREEMEGEEGVMVGGEEMASREYEE